MLLVEPGPGRRAEELASGRPRPARAKATPPLTAARCAAMVTGRAAPTSARPRRRRASRSGDAVRARNINPTGHTRLPRYARGQSGDHRPLHGAHVFPDGNAHFRGEDPQHLYTVRFAARELWGEAAAPRDGVYIDLWERYLEPA